MRLLLTGAGGRLAGAVARRLARRADIALTTEALDLADRAATEARLRAAAPEVVVHALARPGGAPQRRLADTVIATANLALAVGRAAPAARLLLLSCSSVYGATAAPVRLAETDLAAPSDVDGIAVLAAERCAGAACARGGVPFTVLRVFDQDDGAPPPGLVRDLVDPDDVARAVAAVLDGDVWGAIVNVGSGVGTPPAGPTTAWRVADPARCEALLGFRPGADERGARAAGGGR
ncbi:MAG TPA: NAD-dependent epimerase/dehydratase family protein [Caulobacteraceae bacterium]|jgi:nucleoside-diphosphate-sugar epimerase